MVHAMDVPDYMSAHTDRFVPFLSAKDVYFCPVLYSPSPYCFFRVVVISFLTIFLYTCFHWGKNVSEFFGGVLCTYHTQHTCCHHNAFTTKNYVFLSYPKLLFFTISGRSCSAHPASLPGSGAKGVSKYSGDPEDHLEHAQDAHPREESE